MKLHLDLRNEQRATAELSEKATLNDLIQYLHTNHGYPTDGMRIVHGGKILPIK